MNWEVKQRSMYDHPHDGEWFVFSRSHGEYLHSDGQIRPLPIYDDSDTGYYPSKEAAQEAIKAFEIIEGSKQ